MHGIMIDLLREEYRSRHEGPVPPPQQLVWLPWVPAYLALLSPRPPRPSAVLAADFPLETLPAPRHTYACPYCAFSSDGLGMLQHRREAQHLLRTGPGVSVPPRLAEEAEVPHV
jgi:hypothetical protein